MPKPFGGRAYCCAWRCGGRSPLSPGDSTAGVGLMMAMVNGRRGLVDRVPGLSTMTTVYAGARTCGGGGMGGDTAVCERPVSRYPIVLLLTTGSAAGGTSCWPAGGHAAHPAVGRGASSAEASGRALARWWEVALKGVIGPSTRLGVMGAVRGCGRVQPWGATSYGSAGDPDGPGSADLFPFRRPRPVRPWSGRWSTAWAGQAATASAGGARRALTRGACGRQTFLRDPVTPRPWWTHYRWREMSGR